jgi:HAE1 family hydrophobic/amphiphilic exporter-1
LEHVRSVFTTIGTGSRERVNEANLYVALAPKRERDVAERVIMGRAREAIHATVPEARSIAVTRVPWISGIGFGFYDIRYGVQGPELESLANLAQRISAELRRDPYFTDVKTSFEVGRPEVRTIIDRRRAAELGIPAQSVASTIRTLIGGVDAGTYEDDGRRYDIHLRLEHQHRDQLPELGLVQIRSADGRLVDLQNLANLEIAHGPSQIDRKNRIRQVTVLASTLHGVSLGPATQRLEEIVTQVGLPPGYRGEHEGYSEYMYETAKAIRFAFVVALLALYMILASQFNSFSQPAIIMLAAPLSFVGAFAALALAGLGLSVFVQIGIIMLMGLVMKNGILLVDYANQLRGEGSDTREAVLRAGPVRLRPVLMTTFSTVCGMLPLALSNGDASELRSPVGIMIIGGLLSSMFLTLIAVPVAYTLVGDWDVGLRGTIQRIRESIARSRATRRV